MSVIIARYFGARILQKYWKHILISVSIIGVIIFFLLFGGTASTIQTGTGNLPQTNIEHISTFDSLEGYYVTFTVIATDEDADLLNIEVQMKSTRATLFVEGSDGAFYNISNWVVVWSETVFAVNQTSYTNTFKLTMLEDISFGIRSVVTDVGDNIVYHEISSGVSKVDVKDITAPGFELFVLVATLIPVIKLRNRKKTD